METDAEKTIDDGNKYVLQPGESHIQHEIGLTTVPVSNRVDGAEIKRKPSD